MINIKGIFWKISLPILALFAVTIAALAVYIPKQLEQATIESVVMSAEQTVSQFKTLRKYYTQNIIKKVLASNDIRPAIDHAGQANKVPLPATMIHDLSSLLDKQGMSLKLYSEFPFPGRSGRQLDSFQKEAWSSLNKDPKTTHVSERINGGSTIVSVAVADLMVADACVACHNSHPDTPKNDWKLGDVRGVLQVDTNIDAQLAAGQATSDKIVSLLIVILILLLGVIYWVYQRVIGTRIKQLNTAMDDIAKGEANLQHKLSMSGTDEISRLTDSFNIFIGKIHQIVLQTISTSADISTMAQQMSTATDSSRDRIAQQHKEIDLAATAINQMTATVQEIAQSATSAASSTKDSLQATGQGQQEVERTMTVIRSLADEVEKASNVIGELKQNTESIGSVVDVINSIADQTNLLALNAAIEAARAGEQGRGFAVVADEVRSLASRTQSSTQEIREMIEHLQQGTGNAVSVMEQGCNQASASVEQASKAGDSLLVINDAMQHIMDQNQQIASATEEQGAVSHEIERNIESIRDVTGEAAQDSDLNAKNAEQLLQLSTQLSSLVSQFRV